MSGLQIELKSLAPAGQLQHTSSLKDPLLGPSIQIPYTKTPSPDSTFLTSGAYPGRMQEEESLNHLGERMEAAVDELPDEDLHTIVFPWSEETRGFLVEGDHKKLALECITLEELDLVFSRLRESKYHDLYGGMHYRLAIPIIAVMATVFLIYIFYRDVFTLGWATIYFCLTVVILLGLSAAASMYWNSYVKERLQNRERDFDTILEKLNADLFSARSLSWKCGHFGTFVELDLNRREKARQLGEWVPTA